jgi:hypothetical protein
MVQDFSSHEWSTLKRFLGLPQTLDLCKNYGHTKFHGKKIVVVQATGHSLKYMIPSLITIINQSLIDDCNSAGQRTLFKMNDSITYNNR